MMRDTKLLSDKPKSEFIHLWYPLKQSIYWDKLYILVTTRKKVEMLDSADRN